MDTTDRKPDMVDAYFAIRVLRAALLAYMEPAGDTPEELRMKAKSALRFAQKALPLERIIEDGPDNSQLLLERGLCMSKGETMNETREQLAVYAHEAWSGWTQYLFDQSYVLHDFHGLEERVIPAWAVERWTRQMITPYAELPEQEKESDRQEADKILAILGIDNSC